MGYKESSEQWTEHESNFSALLESLSGKTENIQKPMLNSLEKKSQESKARVHYHKFTRGKDLSKYSEKDLANIFGKRNLKEFKTDNKRIITEPVEENVPSIKKNTLLFNGGSMHDYFKKKLSNFTGFSGNVMEKYNCENEEELRPSFGIGYKLDKSHNKEDLIKIDGNKSVFSCSQNESGKRKVKKQLENIISPSKKVKKEKLKDKEKLGLSNPAFNPMTTPVKVIKHTLSTIEESSESTENVIHSDSYNNVTFSQISVEKIRKIKNEGNNSIFKIEPQINVGENVFCQIETNDSEPPKKKKKGNSVLGISNPLFEINLENKDGCEEQGEFYEVEHRKLKKTKKHFQINNVPNNQENDNTSFSSGLAIGGEVQDKSVVYKNPYEIKVKKKKAKDVQRELDNLGLNNPVFEGYTEKESCVENNNIPFLVKSGINEQNIAELVGDSEKKSFEVKRKRRKNNNKKKDIIINISQVEGDSSEVNSVNGSKSNDTIDVDNCELILNIVHEPTELKPNLKVGKMRRNGRHQTQKSVRFSDITEELIIPNNDEIKSMETTYQNGIDNENFDSRQTHMSENLETISKTLEMYQAEIENDINEQKVATFEEIMVGDIGNPEGENEKLPDSTRLKFKYANVEERTPMYQLNKTGPKKSYKHLIKGDIILKFNNTNLHEIKGYGTVKTKRHNK